MSGFFDLVKEYPTIVSEGFRLSTDSPRIPELRIDPHGEKKAEEKHRLHREFQESLKKSGFEDSLSPSSSGHRAPPLKVIHLQWRDTEYERWVDTSIFINLEKKTIHQCESWLLGRQHEGSGAIGVILFASPFLVLGAPYILGRNRLFKSSEHKAGMSRHGIALMKALKGHLNTETESLLRTALQNKFAHEKKMHQYPSLEEACALLDCCTLRMDTHPGDDERPSLFAYHWYDNEGSRIGCANYEVHRDGKEHFYPVYVFSSVFRDDEAKELIERFGNRTLE